MNTSTRRFFPALLATIVLVSVKCPESDAGEAAAKNIMDVRNGTMVVAHFGCVNVRESQTGKSIVDLRGPDQIVSLSADGRFAIAADFAGVVAVWRIADATVLARCKFDDTPSSVGVSAHGKTAVVGFEHGKFRVLNVADGKVSWEGSHGEKRMIAALSADGAMVATCGYSGNRRSAFTVKLWDVAKQTSRELRCRFGRPRCIRFANDGRHLIVAGKVNVGVWDTTGSRLVRHVHMLGDVYVSAADYSNGKLAIGVGRFGYTPTKNRSGRVLLYDIAKRKPQAKWVVGSRHAGDVVFDGDTIVAMGDAGIVRLNRAEKGHWYGAILRLIYR